ncbi:MAG TPA: tetratricopeptide repeat protein, partial [Longimicrobium sp.]|nr:tetratricopeptide repeat protein [Longimicrobium sp.]
RLAAIYREAGRRVDALRELRAGLVSKSDDAGLNAELGHLLLDSRRPAEATRAFRRALDGDPASERAWIGLVRALRENGRNDQADQVLARAPAPVRELVPRMAPAPMPGAASMPDPNVVPPVR